MKTTIHSTAIIDPSAKIGEGVEVSPYAIVGPGSEIGDGCRIGSHSVIEYAQLGKNCIVYPFASIGLTPQHLGYKNEPTKVMVGERTVFREGVTVHRGSMFDKGVTIVGSDCYFMAYSHVAHDCVVGNNVILANAAQLAGHVQVGDRCFISSTAGIHQFVRIGQMSMVSGGAMVPMDVAPFCIAQGDRAHIRGLNVVGMRRAGVPKVSMQLIKAAYSALFLSGLKLSEALAHPSLQVNDEYVQKLFHFISTPKRGFIRPRLKVDLKSLEESNT